MTLRFSAIVPNYNDGDQIEASLRSLMAQERPFDEIIVVDDGSVDRSVEVIERVIAGVPGARLIRQEVNRGVVAAINTGLDAATGDFVVLCSANDQYYPHLVRRCEEMLQRYPDVGIVSGNVSAFDREKQQFTYDMKLPLPAVEAYYTPDELAHYNRRVALHFNGGANALRLSLVRRYGGLHPSLRWHSDWFLNLMIAFDTGVAVMPDNLAICYLEGSKSYSSKRFHWPDERPVIEASLRLLRAYPKHASLFRNSGILPKFQVAGLAIFLQREFRWYITPLLLWRMVVFSLTYRVKYILPRPLIMAIRPYFRV